MIRHPENEPEYENTHDCSLKSVIPSIGVIWRVNPTIPRTGVECCMHEVRWSAPSNRLGGINMSVDRDRLGLHADN